MARTSAHQPAQCLVWGCPSRLSSHEMEGSTQGLGTDVGQLQRQLGDIAQVGPRGAGGWSLQPRAPEGSSVLGSVAAGTHPPCPGQQSAASHPVPGRARCLPAAGGGAVAAGGTSLSGPSNTGGGILGERVAGLSPALQDTLLAHGPAPAACAALAAKRAALPGVPSELWAGAVLGLCQVGAVLGPRAPACPEPRDSRVPSGKHCPAQPSHEHRQLGSCPELLACPSMLVVGKRCDGGCPWSSPAVPAPPQSPLPP